MAVAVVVTAMLVVMMIARVARVVMIMVVMMIIRRMTVPRVVVRVMRRVRVTSVGVGATLGIERRFDLDHPRAQSLDHRLNHVVTADSQGACSDLRRQMAIAEMPGDADQMLRVVTSDFQKRLGRGHDFDQAAILEHQRVAATQGDRIFKVEQEFKSARARHRHSPAVTVVKIKHDRIGRRLAPAVVF
jgi:hypothetical protein